MGAGRTREGSQATVHMILIVSNLSPYHEQAAARNQASDRQARSKHVTTRFWFATRPQTLGLGNPGDTFPKSRFRARNLAQVCLDTDGGYPPRPKMFPNGPRRFRIVSRDLYLGPCKFPAEMDAYGAPHGPCNAPLRTFHCPFGPFV